MSLFERLKNKIKDDLIVEMNNTGSDDPWDSKDTKTKTKNNKKPKIETGTYNYSKNNKKTKRRSTPSLRSGFDTVELENPEDQTKQKKLKQETSKRENIAKKTSPQKFTPEIDSDTKVDTKQRIRDSKGNVIANPMEPKKTPGSTQISGVQDTDLEKLVKTEPKTRTVKQSEVSKKAKDFTKKINKNRVKYDRSKILQKPEYYKQKYDKLAAKRKEYGFTRDPKTKQFTPSKEGIKRYATKSAQLSSGSNLPVEVTKKQLDTAKVNMTKKYGGKGGVYKAPTKTFAQIKAEYADKKAEKKLKSATRKIEKKFAKELPAKQKLAKTFAPATKADRQFFKATTRVTNPIVKKFAPGAKPVVKKGLKFLTKLGTPGRIAGAAGLALLSPGVRKTVAKVATGAGLGAGLGALAPKPKKPITPTVKKVGINLSQNA